MKKKYDLTSDLIKIEEEPKTMEHNNLQQNDLRNGRLSLAVSNDLKKRIKLYALENDKNITETVEEAILMFLDSKK